MENFIGRIHTVDCDGDLLFCEKTDNITKNTTCIELELSSEKKTLTFDVNFKTDEKGEICIELSITTSSSNIEEINRKCAASHRLKIESRIKERNTLRKRLTNIISQLTHISIPLDPIESEIKDECNTKKT